MGLGTTTYALCKGVTDSWCFPSSGAQPGPPLVPISERGLFDFQWSVNSRKVTDGLSNTIAMGEATYGNSWPVCAASSSDLIWSGTTLQDQRTVPAPVDSTGQQRTAWQAWICAGPAWKSAHSGAGFYWGSVMACTLEAMNKNPVTQGQADESNFDSCAKSQRSAPGTTEPTTGQGSPSGVAGTHLTPNFRSDHSGGCNFLFADGSVHFLGDTTDMLLYQQLSTIQGNELVAIPPE